MYCENIIIGAGPSALQLGYFFKKENINYVILEKADCCASFFKKYPITDNLISLNKKYTGETDRDFNLRHDWNSLLNDENFLFTNFSDDLFAISLYRHRLHGPPICLLDLLLHPEQSNNGPEGLKASLGLSKSTLLRMFLIV